MFLSPHPASSSPSNVDIMTVTTLIDRLNKVLCRIWYERGYLVTFFSANFLAIVYTEELNLAQQEHKQVLPKQFGNSTSFSHNYATKSPLVTMGRPKFTPKTAPSPSTITNPSITPIPWPTPLTTPNGIRIQSAILPQYTLRTDRPTDRQRDGQANVPYHKRSARYADRERRAKN